MIYTTCFFSGVSDVVLIPKQNKGKKKQFYHLWGRYAGGDLANDVTLFLIYLWNRAEFVNGIDPPKTPSLGGSTTC